MCRYTHMYTQLISPQTLFNLLTTSEATVSLLWEWAIGFKVVKAFDAERLEEALNLPRTRE